MIIPLSDYTIGATVASDLVNTSPTVRVTTGDALPDAAALRRFLAERGVRLDAPPPTDDDLRLVHMLRMQIRVILETETEEHAIAGSTVLIKRAGLAPVLHRDDDGRWQWHLPTAPGAPLADELAALVGVGLAGVVRTLGRERFRTCAAPGCRGVFVDTSRAGKRRYCMPERCGNRVNVARHRARRLGSVAR
ncbi:hypothetical protein Acsp04_09070 [Actinomadura sp. NBRC 104425]|uniref:CGNR zinc finger domain-containing protein n=1 Tax=Actinomadura sp. NBRC 104425 TaxID=3032204 RepID=UPI0024A4BA7D|nr:CGNR zinc finger domain-containing protein [Actinomadura sp. NBRC 104425]GLZ10672.1 hypothetical protein Acsp04_09070 [Actinomadura sp. NBRC 104425]